MEAYIYIQPIQLPHAEVLDRQTTMRLSVDLALKFGMECKVAPLIALDEDAYDPLREHPISAAILSKLKSRGYSYASKVLGIVSEDLYADTLSFVFGQAELGGKYGVISTSRLHPNPQDRNSSIFYERILKESVHELGHTFGLEHCPNVQCVMHFSNTLRDTDIKSASFCGHCETWLGMRLKKVAN
ncbi:MAG: archaemetzincin family Zn-dependent metalloprotease [Dehalococcoidales bacterium]|nr:archaemetzincin family Zn-dependent metalloprotease [Dehalococcoidales bacterium]